MSGRTVKLDRVLYGLKQVGRQWNTCLVDEVVGFRMEQHITEPCVFREIVDDKGTLILSVHVDEIIVTGKETDCNRRFDALSGIDLVRRMYVQSGLKEGYPKDGRMFFVD